CIMRASPAMEVNSSELERHLSDLQLQIERLRQMSDVNMHAVEQQLAGIAEHSEDLKRWAITTEDTLRQTYEQPVKELREHAASLTEVCIATARVAQKGFDRAEARLTSLENDVHRRLTEVAKDLQSAVAEIRRHQPPRLDSAAPWAFDDVLRLHSQLRDSDSRPGGGAVRSLDP